jgi:ribosomal protein S18 acetylase RimI-like enzyme
MDGVDIRLLTSADLAVLVAATDLFDRPVDPEHAQRLLETTDHVVLLAMAGDDPVGFVTGVEILHPDKGPEMFLNELAVAESHRRRGIGIALVTALRDLARARDCRAMWVLTDHDNAAAVATYEKAGPTPGTTHVMFDWPLTDSP